MKPAELRPYSRADREVGHDLPLAFWAPVFAETRDAVSRFVCDAFHPEDRMGERTSDAVDPARQGQGIGRQLLAHGDAVIRASGAELVTADTVGDPGHARARRVFAVAGDQNWPVARFVKPLAR